MRFSHDYRGWIPVLRTFSQLENFDGSQEASGGSLNVFRLCCSPFPDFFTEIFPAARAAPGIVPGTGRVFSAVGSSLTPDFPAGCAWSRRCPAGREGGPGCFPHSLTSLALEKGILSSGGRQREKMLPNPAAGRGR